MFSQKCTTDLAGSQKTHLLFPAYIYKESADKHYFYLKPRDQKITFDKNWGQKAMRVQIHKNIPKLNVARESMA
jgi:hypothetical protein